MRKVCCAVLPKERSISGIECMSAAGSGLYVLTPECLCVLMSNSNTQAQSTLPEEATVLPSGTGESLETCPIAPPCTQVYVAWLNGEGEGLC